MHTHERVGGNMDVCYETAWVAGPSPLTTTPLPLMATAAPRRFVKRDHIVRPHIEELLRLHPHFRIGVFSSATVRTVNTALDTLYAALQRSAALRGIGR